MCEDKPKELTFNGHFNSNEFGVEYMGVNLSFPVPTKKEDALKIFKEKIAAWFENF